MTQDETLRPLRNCEENLHTYHFQKELLDIFFFYCTQILRAISEKMSAERKNSSPTSPSHVDVGRHVSFVEPDEPFADDDLVSESQEEALDCMEGTDKNYLERDDFEFELGSPAEDHWSEDFTDIAAYEIVDVIGDDRAGRPVVVIYAYRLPAHTPPVDPTRPFDHQKFLRYLTHTLDKFVEQDYTIVYFHYGLRSYNKPTTRWLVQAYRLLDRKYKKNLKALYVVHPTRFIKIVWVMFRPFISAKFERKMQYVNYLHELREQLHCDQLVVAKEIEDHDRTLLMRGKVQAKPLPIKQLLPTQQFGVTLAFILKNNPGAKLPPIVVQTTEYLLAEGLLTEGLFRRSVTVTEVRQTQEKINKGEKIDFQNPHLAAVLLKTFLRELAEPIMTFALYSDVLKIQEVPQDQRTKAVKSLLGKLPSENYALLQYLIKFLTDVMAKCDANLMNANNLAIVFGPNLAWPGDEQVGLVHVNQLTNFTYRLLTNYSEIFVSGVN